MFKLPADERERKTWTNKIPTRNNFVLKPKLFYICELHWPVGYALKAVPGGTRPADPPSIFSENVKKFHFPTPETCRSTEPAKFAERQLEILKKRDEVTSFEKFRPEKELQKQYKNKKIIMSRTKENLVCVFMTDNYSDSVLSFVVENQAT